MVLTDGIENVPPLIAAVAPGIAASTYAIGLGLPSGISTAALDALAEGTGNYLLVTGALTDDQRFRLSKFFLQILAGIGNAQIVVDPSGHLPFGPTHRIAFDIGLADYGLDVILTSPLAPAIEFRLEAPDGTLDRRPGLARRCGGLRRSARRELLPAAAAAGAGLAGCMRDAGMRCCGWTNRA